MPTRPITGPLTRSPSGGVTGVGGGASLSAFSAAKFAIQQNSADVNLLVIGDSTGNETTEWVYLFGQWLATEYPTHSVSYRQWNDTGNVYDAAVSLGSGSGANTIRIWNASVGGTAPVHLMLAAKYPTAIEAIAPDAVIWNHGHNLSSASQANILSLDSAYSPWMERVQATHPGVPHIVMTQNPNRDDDLYAPRYAMLLAMGRDKPALSVVDSYAGFVAAGKSAALYSDSIHPSATGTQIYLQALQSKWRATGGVASAQATDAWLASTGDNLLANGDFSDWSGASPASWVVAPTATVSKELTIVDGADPYSLKVEQTGGTQGYVRQALSPAGLTAAKASGKVSFSARRYMPTSADLQTGQLLVDIAGPTASSRVAYPLNTRLENAWHWMFVRGITIPSDATSVTFYLYASSTNRVNAISYFSRATVVAGSIPRDMA